mmetsp:Transcript_26869/g.66498  ORF Transcript_26869/g.66498 Transcript_26869/m.66498 type:complete len:132 (+) Transcript_26869:624-1019(+)
MRRCDKDASHVKVECSEYEIIHPHQNQPITRPFDAAGVLDGDKALHERVVLDRGGPSHSTLLSPTDGPKSSRLLDRPCKTRMGRNAAAAPRRFGIRLAEALRVQSSRACVWRRCVGLLERGIALLEASKGF